MTKKIILLLLFLNIFFPNISYTSNSLENIYYCKDLNKDCLKDKIKKYKINKKYLKKEIKRRKKYHRGLINAYNKDFNSLYLDEISKNSDIILKLEKLKTKKIIRI